MSWAGVFLRREAASTMSFNAIMLSMMIASKLFVYALHHPESQHIYIGKTVKGVRRIQEHTFPSSFERYAQLPRQRWLKSLRDRGLEPQWVVLETCSTNEELCEAERFYIEYFRWLGIPLLNLTDGGDGILGHKHSESTREKMSQSNRRRDASAEDRSERMRKISQKRWDDPAQHDKCSERQQGKKRKLETIAKISATKTGEKKSAEARANMAAAAKKRWTDPEYRAKQVAAQRAAKASDEARAQASKWARDAWATDEYRAKIADSHDEEYRKKLVARVKVDRAKRKKKDEQPS